MQKGVRVDGVEWKGRKGGVMRTEHRRAICAEYRVVRDEFRKYRRDVKQYMDAVASGVPMHLLRVPRISVESRPVWTDTEITIFENVYAQYKSSQDVVALVQSRIPYQHSYSIKRLIEIYKEAGWYVGMRRPSLIETRTAPRPPYRKPHRVNTKVLSHKPVAKVPAPPVKDKSAQKKRITLAKKVGESNATKCATECTAPTTSQRLHSLLDEDEEVQIPSKRPSQVIVPKKEKCDSPKNGAFVLVRERGAFTSTALQRPEMGKSIAESDTDEERDDSEEELEQENGHEREQETQREQELEQELERERELERAGELELERELERQRERERQREKERVRERERARERQRQWERELEQEEAEEQEYNAPDDEIEQDRSTEESEYESDDDDYSFLTQPVQKRARGPEGVLCTPLSSHTILRIPKREADSP
ncbi:hypothetical protein Pelo_2477 [Pelomyxa schiedti]|nr:hypothetical protein Pelo_2477 [Pelomyxa schiedti]